MVIVRVTYVLVGTGKQRSEKRKCQSQQSTTGHTSEHNCWHGDHANKTPCALLYVRIIKAIGLLLYYGNEPVRRSTKDNGLTEWLTCSKKMYSSVASILPSNTRWWSVLVVGAPHTRTELHVWPSSVVYCTRTRIASAARLSCPRRFIIRWRIGLAVSGGLRCRIGSALCCIYLRWAARIEQQQCRA